MDVRTGDLLRTYVVVSLCRHLSKFPAGRPIDIANEIRARPQTVACPLSKLKGEDIVFYIKIVVPVGEPHRNRIIGGHQWEVHTLTGQYAATCGYSIGLVRMKPAICAPDR